MSNGSAFSLTLADLSSLKTALDTTGIVGIRSSITNQDTWNVYSSESSFQAPQLIVGFTPVPEPGLGILPLGFVAMWLARRRKK